MLLILLAYFGGILTILSPCILPVLPVVFARADRPCVRSTLPMLAGILLSAAGAFADATVWEAIRASGLAWPTTGLRGR